MGILYLMAFQTTSAPGSRLTNGPLASPDPATGQPELKSLHYRLLDLETRTVGNEAEQGINLLCPSCRQQFFVTTAEIGSVLHYAYSAQRQPVSARIQFSGVFTRLFTPGSMRRRVPIITGLIAFLAALMAGIHWLVSAWLGVLASLIGGGIGRLLIEPLLRVTVAQKMPVFLVPCPHCQRRSPVASDGAHFFMGGVG